MIVPRTGVVALYGHPAGGLLLLERQADGDGQACTVTVTRAGRLREGVTLPGMMFEAPSWSANGHRVACHLGPAQDGAECAGLAVVDVARRPRTIAQQRWDCVFDFDWLDADSLLSPLHREGGSIDRWARLRLDGTVAPLAIAPSPREVSQVRVLGTGSARWMLANEVGRGRLVAARWDAYDSWRWVPLPVEGLPLRLLPSPGRRACLVAVSQMRVAAMSRAVLDGRPWMHWLRVRWSGDRPRAQLLRTDTGSAVCWLDDETVCVQPSGQRDELVLIGQTERVVRLRSGTVGSAGGLNAVAPGPRPEWVWAACDGRLALIDLDDGEVMPVGPGA